MLCETIIQNTKSDFSPFTLKNEKKLKKFKKIFQIVRVHFLFLYLLATFLYLSFLYNSMYGP